ncbi:hypothetical protein A4S06_08600 [Erysipelotrichaceae bacterium MTC7]|nr:hypothetical protein A4S06_08600 [Erysipelotrichaceae bacterium MTC7]
MALLDMYRKKNLQLVVAHVNYHKRDTADRDEKGVCEYCKTYNIPFFAYHVHHYEEGNFQAQARVIRYQFFKTLVEEHHACGVLVAHHQDDVLETYLMQKKRNSIPTSYGIAKESVVKGVLVKRPLLHLRKVDLYAYCKKHHINYYEDESNATNAYTRNKIRHEQVMKLDDEQRQELLEKMQQENEQLETLREHVAPHVKKVLSIQDLGSLSIVEQEQLLYMWLLTYSHYHQISKAYIAQVIERLQKKGNWACDFKKGYEIVCEYGNIKLCKKTKQTYCYQYDELQYESTPYFAIAKQGATIEGIQVKESDFPLWIRSPKPGDTIQLRYGKKKVSRFLIDRKIAKKTREIWPVVENAHGDIIFVSGIGCDVFHYSNNFNMFVIK